MYDFTVRVILHLTYLRWIGAPGLDHRSPGKHVIWHHHRRRYPWWCTLDQGHGGSGHGWCLVGNATLYFRRNRMNSGSGYPRDWNPCDMNYLVNISNLLWGLHSCCLFRKETPTNVLAFLLVLSLVGTRLLYQCVLLEIVLGTRAI